MSRATPDLTQGFTGVSLPKTGPRQMGTDAAGKTSVITFLNQVTESAASLHDNQTDTRPDYLPVNGLWCYTDPDGNKIVYQYDGTTDVELWTVKDGKSSSSGGGGLPMLIPIPVPFNTVLDGFLSVTHDNGILTEASFPEAYAQLVLLQSNGETNIVTMAEYAAELAANGGICGRFALDTVAQTFRIPCAPGAFWRGASAALGLDVGAYQEDAMRPITGGTQYSCLDVDINKLTGSFTNTETSQPCIMGYADATTPKLALDTSLLGDHYSGDDTHPMSVICDYQMKLYGTVSDAGTVSLAQLIAAMTGKLDTSVWDAAGGASLWCPSDTAISLPVPASGGTVTAPGDGWISFYGVSASGGSQIGLYGAVNSAIVSPTAGWGINVFVPVRSGESVRIGYSAVSNLAVAFVPSVGNG